MRIAITSSPIAFSPPNSLQALFCPTNQSLPHPSSLSQPHSPARSLPASFWLELFTHFLRFLSPAPAPWPATAHHGSPLLPAIPHFHQEPRSPSPQTTLQSPQMQSALRDLPAGTPEAAPAAVLPPPSPGDHSFGPSPVTHCLRLSRPSSMSSPSESPRSPMAPPPRQGPGNGRCVSGGRLRERRGPPCPGCVVAVVLVLFFAFLRQSFTGPPALIVQLSAAWWHICLPVASSGCFSPSSDIQVTAQQAHRIHKARKFQVVSDLKWFAICSEKYCLMQEYETGRVNVPWDWVLTGGMTSALSQEDGL